MRAVRMLSQLESVRITGKLFWLRVWPMARATGLAPMIRKPLGPGSATLSSRASGRAVTLCSATVPMITMKVSGTSSSAPATPFSSRRWANRADTAAATMPRGAIHASSAFSRQSRLLPRVATHTDNGRATSWMIASTSRAVAPRLSSCSISRRAASTMNSTEISITDRFSLKWRMSSVRTPLRLAITMPATVTVTRPDSSLMLLDSTKEPITEDSTRKLRRYSGTRWRLSRALSASATAPPMAAPTAIAWKNSHSPCSRAPCWPVATTSS